MSTVNQFSPCAERVGTSSNRLRNGVVALLFAASVLVLPGCVARGAVRLVYGYPAVEVQTVPVEIVTYPRYAYRGSYVYLVDGRWYAQDSGRWVVFREEPRELRRYRETYYRRHPSRAPQHERRPVEYGTPPPEEYDEGSPPRRH